MGFDREFAIKRFTKIMCGLERPRSIHIEVDANMDELPTIKYSVEEVLVERVERKNDNEVETR